MKNDLIPTRYSNFIQVEKNFIEKYRENAQKLGIKESEMDKTIEILEDHIKSYNAMISKRAQSKAATEDHIFRNRKAVKEFRRVAKMITSTRAYSQDIGYALGIIGTQSVEKSTDEFKPVIKLFISGENVYMKFVKSRTDGIAIYSKRGTEKNFSCIDYCAKSPFIDTREKLDPDLPERREYYAIYIKSFKETGNPSSVSKIIAP